MCKKLTYFTPTYNREDLLKILYKSLRNQTNNNFTWLIIDDGSTDNTKKIVNDFICENKIDIKYIYKDNGGKNTAIDLAHQLCETEYIACVDSDDFLSKDATNVLYSYFDKIMDSDIVGIVGRRAHYDGVPFNNNWANEPEKIMFYDISKKYNYVEDTFLIFKTNIVKNYTFPKIEKEKFITEAVLYQQFLYDYKILMIPECLYLAEYQEIGYTSQGLSLFFKNPQGHLYNIKQNIYIGRKYKWKFSIIIYNCAKYYAWKRILKIEDKFKDNYKIKFPYNLLGLMFQFLISGKLKKQYKVFLKTNDKSR